MNLQQYFPIWNSLTADQQERIVEVSGAVKVAAGTILHDGDIVIHIRLIEG